MYCLISQALLGEEGKDVHCDGTSSQCTDYSLVKERILQGWGGVGGLVPESQRHKFRNLVEQGGTDVQSNVYSRICFRKGNLIRQDVFITE